jgi:hypothetical protein
MTDEEIAADEYWFFFEKVPGGDWRSDVNLHTLRRMTEPERFERLQHARVEQSRRNSKLKPIRWITNEEQQHRKRRKRRPNKPRLKPINHTLYYCYGASDVPIYIGISIDAGHRMKQHGGTKDWWPEVVSVDMEHFGSRAELESVEKAEIAKYCPKYNKIGVLK